MKKILLACGVSAAIFSMTSCDCCSSVETTPFEDSVSIYLGKQFGGGLSSEIKNAPEDLQKKLDKQRIIAGVEMILCSDTADYGFVQGLQVGMQLNAIMGQFKDGANFNRAELLKAFKETLLADSVDLNADRNTLDRLMNKVQERMLAAREEAKQKDPVAIQNKIAGADFINRVLAENKDAVKTESGLVYVVTKAAKGEKPVATDRVKVKYEGKLIDGTVFDKNEEGTEFMVTGVIPGFSEGLQLMEKGSKYTFYIPGDIAYGINGAGAQIGPNATLIFEVELLDIIK